MALFSRNHFWWGLRNYLGVSGIGPMWPTYKASAFTTALLALSLKFLANQTPDLWNPEDVVLLNASVAKVTWATPQWWGPSKITWAWLGDQKVKELAILHILSEFIIHSNYRVTPAVPIIFNEHPKYKLLKILFYVMMLILFFISHN